MNRFDPKPITVAEVRAVQAVTSAPLMEIKREINRRRAQESLELLRREGSLADKVEYLLDRFEASLK